MTLPQSVDYYNPQCRDLLHSGNSYYLLYARERWGKDQCSELISVCGDFRRDGTLVRALCPETCGCNQPNSSLPVYTPNYGCPSACTQTSTWLDVQKHALCFNPTVNHLNQTSYWPHWVEFTARHEKWGGDELLGQALARYGCDFQNGLPPTPRTQKSKGQLCRGTTAVGVKPIAIACPQTCGCSEPGDREDCIHGPFNC
mmetsp:Transcript_77366/g.137049  ORF Transcript_77366/g.137049 Transcript_77366/m.137049 type:complete len:200 (-) Transcript_77366:18-617(-)